MAHLYRITKQKWLNDVEQSNEIIFEEQRPIATKDGTVALCNEYKDMENMVGGEKVEFKVILVDTESGMEDMIHFVQKCIFHQPQPE